MDENLRGPFQEVVGGGVGAGITGAQHTSEIEPSGQATLFDHDGGANVTSYSSLDGISFRVP